MSNHNTISITPLAKEALEKEVERLRATGITASRKGVASGLIINACANKQNSINKKETV